MVFAQECGTKKFKDSLRKLNDIVTNLPLSKSTKGSA